MDFVVDQHLLHFPDGFFARLGRAFMREYYRAFLTDDSGSAWGAELHGRLVGYLVGTTNPAQHRDHVMRRHGRRLATRALWALIWRPGLATLFLRTRARLYAGKLAGRAFGRRFGPGNSVAHTPTNVAVLAHVAVAPHAQGLGLGTKLIDRFANAASRAGCEQIDLVTTSHGGAGDYYVRHGWTPIDKHTTRDGVPLETYSLSISARLSS